MGSWEISNIGFPKMNSGREVGKRFLFYLKSSRNLAREREAMAKAEADSRQFEGDYQQLLREASKFPSMLRYIDQKHRAVVEAHVRLIEFNNKACSRRKLFACGLRMT